MANKTKIEKKLDDINITIKKPKKRVGAMVVGTGAPIKIDFPKDHNVYKVKG